MKKIVTKLAQQTPPNTTGLPPEVASEAVTQHANPDLPDGSSLGGHLSPEVQQQIDKIEQLLQEAQRVLTQIKQLNNANGIARQPVTDHVKP